MPAARQPIRGAERVAGFLVRGVRAVEFDATTIWLNGAPALRVDVDGTLDTTVSVAVENGRITGIFAIRAPDKLARLGDVAPLTRS